VVPHDCASGPQANCRGSGNSGGRESLACLIFLRRMGPLGSMFVLSAAVLAVTGGEALFADLGHFGVGPIRLAWLVLVYRLCS